MYQKAHTNAPQYAIIFSKLLGRYNIDDIKNTEIIGFHKPDEPHGCFSNWYPAEFELAGICYANSEQYMMYQKVRLGRRFDLADMIMKTRIP